jgi:hypothetical protein
VSEFLFLSLSSSKYQAYQFLKISIVLFVMNLVTHSIDKVASANGGFQICRILTDHNCLLLLGQYNYLSIVARVVMLILCYLTLF